MTTSVHSRRKDAAVPEWAMWLLWKAAAVTGAAPAARKLVRWWRRQVRPQLPRLADAAHQAAIRIELAIGDLLVDSAGRLQRRAPYVISGTLLLGDLLWLAVR